MPPEEAAAAGSEDPGDSPGGPEHEVAIAIEGTGWQGVEQAERACRAAALAVLGAAGPRRPVTLGILLADDAELRALNRRYRGRDAPTNVLSFPATDDIEATPAAFLTAEGRVALGDIALAFETVAAEARDQHKALLDHARHLVVHGTLHLLGHDHADDAQALAMEEAERRILAGLGVANPYAEPTAALPERIA